MSLHDLGSTSAVDACLTGKPGTEKVSDNFLGGRESGAYKG